MVETRASKRTTELGRLQEVPPLVAEATPAIHPSLVYPAVVIQLVQPLHSDCSGFFAKTYHRRLFKPIEGTAGKVCNNSHRPIFLVMYDATDDF